MRAVKLAVTLVTGAAAFGVLAAGQAQAQGLTTALPAVQQCLCAQQTVSILGREMRQSQRRNRDAHANLDAFTQQVEAARGRVNVDNRSDIEAFSAMLARRDAMAESVRQEDYRNAAAVSRYNAAVEQDNAACSGRLFDPEEVEAVKANLACPRP